MVNKTSTILVADDDAGHRAVLRTLLADWGYAVLEAADGREAVSMCLRGPVPDMALIDVRMPGLNGMEVMREIKKSGSDLPVVIMTAYSEVPAAVEAIRNGAYDYLTKPLDFPRLEIIIRNALAQVDLARQNASLSATLAASEKAVKLLGHSKPMLELEKLIQTVAPTDATVLIGGESGTGKELAARAVHSASKRAKGPFVAINCGALTETLLASELFGHEKGAFTGADKKHDGLFVEATGGTIFLDEIGEMTPAMQVKLLRVLQEREVLRVGGKKPLPIDCRIIAATNRDLGEEIDKGNFRRDLYYRLNVVSINMPPLRERKEDIPVLAAEFANRFAIANHKRVAGITRQAIERLTEYDWPGNARELENVMERAVILMLGEYIGERELPERILKYGACMPGSPQTGGERHAIVETSQYSNKNTSPAMAVSLVESGGNYPTLEEVERNVILQTLKRLGNNKTEAAKALGITRKTLHAKLNRYRAEED